MRSLTTIIDLGDLGQREVVVTYHHYDSGITLNSVLGMGMDLLPMMEQEAEDALMDICQADYASSLVEARDAYWEMKRDERLLRTA